MVRIWTIVVTAMLITGCSSAVNPEATSATPLPDTAQQSQMLPLEAEAIIGDQTFKLEVARTSSQQRLGLMFRDLESLPADQGMLFPYDPPRSAAFWMYNTWINLDIIFLLEGRVVYIAADVPGCPELPCPSYGPANDQLVDQVVEFRGGTAAQLGLTVGDPVIIQAL